MQVNSRLLSEQPSLYYHSEQTLQSLQHQLPKIAETQQQVTTNQHTAGLLQRLAWQQESTVQVLP